MKLGEIDFPSKLIEAIRDGELVVFAGAGVSMGAPANLPDFGALADKIAEGTGEMRGEGEEIDQFLGRLSKDFDSDEDGVKVHKIAADVLKKGDPKPSSLHLDILRLFRGNTRKTRLVTTNFDLLFEIAAYDVFDPRPSVFSAPALPRGSDFTGIVHVHGDIGDPKNMVLSVRDFGAAYLTEGWARRFLVDVFRSHDVLFVGYSHEDTIMEYLASALVADSSRARFALTDRDIESWQRRGIIPIVFPNESGDFAALASGVSELADTLNRGASDWQALVRELATLPPAELSETKTDQLDYALAVEANVRTFVQATDDPQWLAWLDQRRHFKRLFADGVMDDRDVQYGNWIATRIATKDADAVFRLFKKIGERPHRHFWFLMVRGVSADQEQGLTDDEYRRWASVLMLTAPERIEGFELTWLSANCSDRGLSRLALGFIDKFASANVLRRFDSNTTQTVGRYGNNESIRDALADAVANLRPFMADEANSMIELAVRHIADQHDEDVTWGQGNDRIDPWSFWRESIDTTDDQKDFGPIHPLINVARDALVYLARNKEVQVMAWIERLSQSDVPLLRRLASFAVSELPQ